MINPVFQSGVTALRRRICGFRNDEGGALIVFALILFTLMVMMGGLALDLMRGETTRVNLVQTADRAALAAAALNNRLDPEAVARDYMLKAGLADQVTSITVTNDLNYRSVQIQGVADTHPLFLHMLGIDRYDVHANTKAEQGMDNIEIMLVLDVSGSMLNNNKLVNLKIAANQFISTILANDVEHKISIGIVPFNGQVNLGNELKTHFNLTDINGQAGVNCVDLPAAAYDALAIPQDMPLSMTSNADTYSGTGTITPREANKWCPGATAYTGDPAGTGGNIVRLPQQDIATLQGYINGLSAVGATSINAGMKWGETLLDPSVRNIYADAIGSGRMPATMAGRPQAYDAQGVMKFIVLMTDGENFPEERVNAGYKTGPSPLFQSNSDGRWSIFHASRVDATNATTLCNSRPYYVPTQATKWQSRPWNGTTPSASACYDPNAAVSGATRRSWQEVWASMGMQYVAQTYYASALGGSYATYLNMFRSKTDTSTANTPVMDGQVASACTQAKDAGIVVFGIAFEAPPNGQATIRNCASSDAHYFDASGMEIATAFAAIATNITQLKLTQ